jgi:hypothetical protein
VFILVFQKGGVIRTLDMMHLPLLNPCILILEMYQRVEGFVTCWEDRSLLLVEKYSASTLLTVNNKGH